MALVQAIILTAERAADLQNVKRHSGQQLKAVDQVDIERTGQFDVTRHMQPVELGQRFISTAVEFSAQFGFLAACAFVIVTVNRHHACRVAGFDHSVVGPTATDVATASVCTVVGEGSASRMNRADVEQRAAVVVGQRAELGYTVQFTSRYRGHRVAILTAGVVCCVGESRHDFAR